MASNPSRYALCKLIKLSTSKINSDKLKKKIEKRLNAKLQLEVGFFETAKYSTGEYVAQVAFWNEYGTKISPPRPFFRNAVKDKSKEWLELFRDTQFKTKDIYKTLGIVGTIAKDDIATSITDLSSPPNSDITINGGWIRHANGKAFKVKGKKSSNPLVDTGHMGDSVTFEITEKGKK